ncbi:putative reverse transcriptase domain-containing protein [Tanacetum coccineum]
MKDNLCNAPILSLPDGSEYFVVYYDTSNQGLGYVLMQRGKVIAYASRQLNIHEKNYTIHYFKIGAMVFAFKTWRHYLYGTKSVIYMDHKSFQHIFVQKELNMRQRRWIELFSFYDCEICYHPGKANVVADAFSRKERVKPRRVRAMSMTIRSSITDKILAAQGEASKVGNATAEILRGLDQQMEKKEDGAGKTYYDLGDMHWWPCMKKDVATYHEIPEWKWDRNTMDFITKFPSLSSGHDTIWVAVLWSEMEKVVDWDQSWYKRQLIREILIKERLKAARDRQKSYADNRRKPLEFEVGDQVLLKVSPCEVL